MSRWQAWTEGLRNGGFGKTGTGPRPNDKLTVPTKDIVFSYQTGRKDFASLSVDVLLLGKICETRPYATSVYTTLTKLGIIDAKTGYIDTNRIEGRMLLNKIALLPVHKIRELVDLLFWWEEEMRRWNAAEQEKDRFIAAVHEAMPIDTEERAERIKEGVKIIEDMKRTVPSRRGGADHPAAVASRHNSVSSNSGGAAATAAAATGAVEQTPQSESNAAATPAPPPAVDDTHLLNGDSELPPYVHRVGNTTAAATVSSRPLERVPSSSTPPPPFRGLATPHDSELPAYDGRRA